MRRRERGQCPRRGRGGGLRGGDVPVHINIKTAFHISISNPSQSLAPASHWDSTLGPPPQPLPTQGGPINIYSTLRE